MYGTKHVVGVRDREASKELVIVRQYFDFMCRSSYPGILKSVQLAEKGRTESFY